MGQAPRIIRVTIQLAWRLVVWLRFSSDRSTSAPRRRSRRRGVSANQYRGFPAPPNNRLRIKSETRKCSAGFGRYRAAEISVYRFTAEPQCTVRLKGFGVEHDHMLIGHRMLRRVCPIPYCVPRNEAPGSGRHGTIEWPLPFAHITVFIWVYILSLANLQALVTGNYRGPRCLGREVRLRWRGV